MVAMIALWLVMAPVIGAIASATRKGAPDLLQRGRVERSAVDLRCHAA